MSGIYGKGKRGKATRLHSLVVRQRGHCENPDCKGTGTRLECAHIISRRYAATRCDPWNALALCSADHRYFTEWPVEFNRLICETLLTPEWYDDLRARAMAGPGEPSGSDAPFWQGWIDRLTPMLEDAA